VVTLPHDLQVLARCNPELVYNLLFEAASRALLQLARDYERLRAQVGFTAVLHTSEQDLNWHPHLRLVVTGGGLSLDGDRWIAAQNSYLILVRALSKIIRGKFLEALEKAWHEGKLRGQVPPAQFQRFLRKLRRKKWVVYAKEVFGGSHQAFHYLSRYTHRVAISNQRLVSLAAGKVTFQARDNHRPGVYPPLPLARSPTPVCQNPTLRPHGPPQCQNQTGESPGPPQPPNPRTHV
jgi:hypothetical protein